MMCQYRFSYFICHPKKGSITPEYMSKFIRDTARIRFYAPVITLLSGFLYGFLFTLYACNKHCPQHFNTTVIMQHDPNLLCNTDYCIDCIYTNIVSNTTYVKLWDIEDLPMDTDCSQPIFITVISVQVFIAVLFSYITVSLFTAVSYLDNTWFWYYYTSELEEKTKLVLFINIFLWPIVYIYYVILYICLIIYCIYKIGKYCIISIFECLFCFCSSMVETEEKTTIISLGGNNKHLISLKTYNSFE